MRGMGIGRLIVLVIKVLVIYGFRIHRRKISRHGDLLRRHAAVQIFDERTGFVSNFEKMTKYIPGEGAYQKDGSTFMQNAAYEWHEDKLKL